MMSQKRFYPIPGRDPIGGGALYISELSSEDSGIAIRGRFEVPRYSRLDADQANFLEIFLRCRGNLTAVERELNMSYPTVRARLDQMLAALELAPVPETPKKDLDKKRQILDQLERGEINAEEAKTKLKEIRE
jgi:hypothetical protein